MSVRYDNTSLRIAVKNLRNVPIPVQKHEGEWYDLNAGERVELKEGEHYNIPLGIAVELPKGYEAHIAPRSSSFKNWGIIQTNGVGVIDNKYCGNNDEWSMPVYATRNAVIEKGDRICQFRIMLQQHPSYITVVKSLNNINRGGFGSTGVR